MEPNRRGVRKDASPARPLDLGILFAATIALFLGLGRRPATSIQELRVLESAREMQESGDLIVPRFLGEPRFQKPPLAYWLALAGYAAAGEPSEAAGRLYSAVSGALIALLLAFGLPAVPRKRGVLAGLIFLTSALASRACRRAETDALLALCTTASAIAFFRAFDPAAPDFGSQGSSRAPRTGRLLLGWASAALGFLAKGPAGLAYPLLAIAFYLALSRRWRDLGRLASPAGIAVFCVLAFPWFAAVVLREGHSLGVFFSEVRAATAGGGHTKRFAYSLVYYLIYSMREFAPWSPLLVLAGVGLATGEWQRGANRFLIAWAAGVLLPLEVIGQKQAHYLIPAFPPLALLVAGWIEGGEPFERWFPPPWRLRISRVAALGAIGGSLAWAYGLFDVEDDGARPFALAARETIEASGPLPLYTLQEDRAALSFYLRRVVHPLEDRAAWEARLSQGESLLAIVPAPGSKRGAAAREDLAWDPSADPRFRLLLEAPEGPRALRLYRAEPSGAR